MAGGVKGNSGSGSGRGRSYWLMLILAFGAAVFGVMLIHKLRDKRIFNIVVQEKDRQLLSLQLILQRERESNKEGRRKIEELKAKTASLKSHKMELHGRIVSMQSTIASLKEEHKVLETALDEKQNEIRALRGRETDSKEENSRVVALTEMLKQKEAEIKDLKQHLESRVNVWSVSADDPSNPPLNLTVKASKEQNEQLHGAINDGNGENSGGSEEGEAQLQESENAGEGGGNGNGDSQEEVDSGTKEEKNNLTSSTEVGKSGDYDTKIEAIEDKEHGIARAEQLAKLENSQDGEGQNLGMTHGEVKMEMAEGSTKGADSREKGKRAHASRTKGKKWKILAKRREQENNGNTENHGAASIRRNRFSKAALKDEIHETWREEGLEKKNVNQLEFPNKSSTIGAGHQDGLEGQKVGAVSGEVGTGNVAGDVDSDNPSEVVSSNLRLLKPPNTEDSEGLENRFSNADTSQELGGQNEISSEREGTGVHQSPDEDEAGNITGKKQEQGQQVREDEEKEGGDIQQEMGTRNTHEAEENDEQAKVGEVDKEQKDLEFATDRQPKTEAFSGDTTLGDEFDNYKEEYKSEIDEPEF